MFPVKSFVEFPGLNYADVCPNQPDGNKAFCLEHVESAKTAGYPTEVKQFIKFCKGNSLENCLIDKLPVLLAHDWGIYRFLYNHHLVVYMCILYVVISYTCT